MFLLIFQKILIITQMSVFAAVPNQERYLKILRLVFKLRHPYSLSDT
jgi:hypothetical protein